MSVIRIPNDKKKLGIRNVSSISKVDRVPSVNLIFPRYMRSSNRFTTSLLAFYCFPLIFRFNECVGADIVCAHDHTFRLYHGISTVLLPKFQPHQQKCQHTSPLELMTTQIDFVQSDSVEASKNKRSAMPGILQSSLNDRLTPLKGIHIYDTLQCVLCGTHQSVGCIKNISTPSETDKRHTHTQWQMSTTQPPIK